MKTFSFVLVSILAISGLAVADEGPASRTECHPRPTVTKPLPNARCRTGPVCKQEFIKCPTPTTIHVPCRCETKPVTTYACPTGCNNCPPPFKLDHKIPGQMCASD